MCQSLSFAELGSINLPSQGKYQFVYDLPCPASPIWVPEPAALPYVVACEALSDPNKTSPGYHFFLPLEPSIRLPNSRGFTLAPTPEVLFPRLLMYIDDVTTFSVKHSLQGAALPQQGSLGEPLHLATRFTSKNRPPTWNHPHL
ncbi:hypothetical protein ACFE04_023321 [Oxalis oulophora]